MLSTQSSRKFRIPTSVLGIGLTLVWGLGLYGFASFNSPLLKALGVLVAFAAAFGSAWFQIIDNAERAKGVEDEKLQGSGILTQRQNTIILSCVWAFGLLLCWFIFDRQAFQNMFVMLTTLYLGTIIAGIILKESN